ncbi:hypothetical protein QA640_36960 [Bradyrhizobium sp. CB82]|uniref:hypothetical protein n=1 Tax=Bradyrhizobium sp. CB82 TaxID=3039159 RepID=UPI0024B12A67|nr:hypothetical protein [Bradyrhizobium sp. CB82]WFU39869.1 hypothetical protein QA640_36960 [Bradyrhizobium sp. CB82]
MMEPEEWQHFWGELDFGGRLNFLSTTELVRAQQEGKWSETRAMVMAALDHAIALLSAGESIELLGAKVEGLHYGRELMSAIKEEENGKKDWTDREPRAKSRRVLRAEMVATLNKYKTFLNDSAVDGPPKPRLVERSPEEMQKSADAIRKTLDDFAAGKIGNDPWKR